MTKTVKAPLDSTRVRALGFIWSLVLIAAGVVAVREAAVAFDWIDGGAWIASALRSFDGLAADTWMFPASIAGALVGLMLLINALRPRRRVGFELEADAAVYVMPRALASVALTSINRVDGVWAATAQAKRKKLKFTAKAASTDRELQDRARSAVDERLAPVVRGPRIKVRLKQDVAES